MASINEDIFVLSKVSLEFVVFKAAYFLKFVRPSFKSLNLSKKNENKFNQILKLS